MMMITRRQLLTRGAIGLTAAAAGARVALAANETAAAEIAHPLLGSVTAPKRLVAWGSLTCPFTAMLFQHLAPIVHDMPETASVEWRHFPLHKPDPALHVAALAFEGSHFWGFAFKVLGEVLARGGQFATLTPEKIAEFAKAEGGSEETIQAAYANPANWAAVKQDLLAGHLLGVRTTPGLFFNGYFLTPSGLPLDRKAFDASLRAMLKHG